MNGPQSGQAKTDYTYLFLLLIEVVNDNSNEEVEGEERAKDDEEHKVEVHVNIHLANWLLPHLVTKMFVLFAFKGCQLYILLIINHGHPGGGQIFNFSEPISLTLNAGI